MIGVFAVPDVAAFFHMKYPGNLHVLYALSTSLGFVFCLEILKIARRKKSSGLPAQ
jgi:hypothetical protein